MLIKASPALSSRFTCTRSRARPYLIRTEMRGLASSISRYDTLVLVGSHRFSLTSHQDFVVYILELRKNPSASLNRVADLIGLSQGDQWLPIKEDANVFQCFRRFYRTRFHRLPVVDEHDSSKVLRMVRAYCRYCVLTVVLSSCRSRICSPSWQRRAASSATR